jgi:hypothetical protein
MSPLRYCAAALACVCWAQDMAAQQGPFKLERIDSGWRIADRSGKTFFPRTPDRTVRSVAELHSRDYTASPLPLTEPFPFFAEIALTNVPREDVFDPESEEHLKQRIRMVCERFKNNPYLIAYRLTNVSPWTPEWVSAIRRLPAEHPGRQHYADFLKETYAYNIGEVDRAYGLDITSFTDLGAADLSGVDAKRPAVVRDDREFLGAIAQALYNTATAEIRRIDPAHLIFSEPFTKNGPPLNYAAPAVDVVALSSEATPPPNRPVFRIDTDCSGAPAPAASIVGTQSCPTE